MALLGLRPNARASSSYLGGEWSQLRLEVDGDGKLHRVVFGLAEIPTFDNWKAYKGPILSKFPTPPGFHRTSHKWKIEANHRGNKFFCYRLEDTEFDSVASRDYWVSEMGVVSDLMKVKSVVFPGRERSRALWNQVFGNTSLDRREAYATPVVRGGSYGRSLVSADLATKRLLQSLRSYAPGGWSDNRWEQSKHYTDVSYVCIHRTNEILSEAEFQVFKRDLSLPGGKRPVTPNDPPEGDRISKPYDLVDLLEKPNTEDSFGDLMAQWNLQLELTGMALTWMVPNKIGTPMELYIIPTSTAIPQPAVNPDYPDGYYRIQPLYPYGPFSSYPTPSTAVGAPIPAQWMLRFKYPHPLLRYDGYSPQTGLRMPIDELEAMDRSRWYKMQNASNPDAVLNFADVDGAQPLTEEEVARIHAEWEATHAGPANHGKLVVGTPGATFDTFGPTPREMDYHQSWEQLLSFIMAGWGITKPVAGMVENSSYATLFAGMKQYHMLTLNPKCRRIGARLTRQLAPFFGEDLIVEIRCKRIDDHEIRGQFLDRLASAKAITKNEMRKYASEYMDIAPTKAAWGEEIAGYEKPPEQPGAPLGGMPTMPPADMGAMLKQGQGATMPDEARAEPAQIGASRPDTGEGMAGSLGPRKSLMSKPRYNQQFRQAHNLLTNGNGKGY
jgi:phage portal protein BeeE